MALIEVLTSDTFGQWRQKTNQIGQIVQSLSYDDVNDELILTHSNGTVQKLGQDAFAPPVVNSTGVTVPKATLVMIGSVAGGQINVVPAVTNGSEPVDKILGFAASDILNTATDGSIITSGIISNVNTSTFAAGSFLYPDPLNAGQLTATKPDAPALAVVVALCVVSHATNGVLFVRTAGAGAGGDSSTWVFLTNANNNYATSTNENIVADTTTAAFTILLPSGPSSGDIIKVYDGADFEINNLTIGRNGQTIEGVAEDLVIDISKINLSLVFDGTTWKVFTDQSAAELPDAAGNTNKFLSNNGIIPDWRVISTSDISDEATLAKRDVDNVFTGNQFITKSLPRIELQDASTNDDKFSDASITLWNTQTLSYIGKIGADGTKFGPFGGALVFQPASYLGGSSLPVFIGGGALTSSLYMMPPGHQITTDAGATYDTFFDGNLETLGNLRVSQTLTTVQGITQGTVAASSPQDLSKHFALYSTTYGFCVTSSTLNYNSSVNHDFYSAGVRHLRVTNGGVNFTGYIEETPIVANTGISYTISSTRSFHDLTLTGNVTFTFPTATAGRQFTLLLKQDATGSRTITWPTNVRWAGGTAPTITSTANRTDVISFVAEGAYWLGFVGGLDYTRA